MNASTPNRFRGRAGATGLDIAFFASSLVSAYWNGAATYYRGIVRALSRRGHRITFYEPDAFDRQKHRDIPDPPWARVVVYAADQAGVDGALASARGSDLVVKASGVGVFDQLLEREVLALRGDATAVAFWDVDAPATLDRMRADAADPFRDHLPHYDHVFTYGGGPPVVRAYLALGARSCVPIYNAVDPEVHRPAPGEERFAADLSFLGNRLPDREARVEEFFLRAAEAAPELSFVLGGSGWNDRPLPSNVRHVGHVYTADHNAFNCSARAVLNVSRESMARYGHSPATRVFEAAGAAACLVTDAWDGIDAFLEPGSEVLVAEDGGEVAALVRGLSPERARALGERARRRVLAHHTYARRAERVEEALGLAPRAPRQAARPVRAGAGRRVDRLRMVFLGLSITSSWGNGHATTYRGLVRELCRRGHEVLFLERDRPWYADNRDLPQPPYGRTALYGGLDELDGRHLRDVAEADVVVLGSFVPDGAAVGRWLLDAARGATAFYDIDTPITMARLREGDHDYLAPDLVPRFDLYLSFTGGPTLARIERELGARHAVALHCSVDPEQYAPARRVETTDLGYMGTYSADRQPGLERLLLEPARACPSRRFVVAGPKYPPHLSWPANVERREHLSPPEHAAFYAAQRFTLNLTRSDMMRAGHSPSVRLFEAAACATPIITDPWPGLRCFFEPGREILVAHSTADVLAHLHEVADDRRLALGERARAVVLERHTAEHRAVELEQHVAEAREARAHRRDRVGLAGAGGS